MARTKQQQPESNPSLSIKSVTKSSVWDIQENDVFRMWEAACKDAEVKENVKHYIQMWEQTKKQVTDLKDKMSSEFDRQTQNTEDQKKLQEKLVEMENAYFDLQMENVNLRNELKSIKRMNSDDEL